jgi:hypothetical protein
VRVSNPFLKKNPHLLQERAEVKVNAPHHPYYEGVWVRAKLKRVASAEHLEEGFRESIPEAHSEVSLPRKTGISGAA